MPSQVFRDSEGKWRYRIVGANGEVMAQSQSYTQESDAWRGLRAVHRVLEKDRHNAEEAE